MTLKKIEELDYYELLNLKTNASQEEIEYAYLHGIASFHPNSLASYGLLSPEERKVALARIEEAYQTLSHPEKRKKYDLKLLKMKDKYQEKAYFRKSTKKLEIEDSAKIKLGIWLKLKWLFSLFREKRKEEAEEKEKFKALTLSFQKTHPFYTGEYLKKVRETRGLSLDEISDKSKLNVSLLKALEEENYAALPQGVYFPNLIKLYAQHLGLNLKKLD